MAKARVVLKAKCIGCIAFRRRTVMFGEIYMEEGMSRYQYNSGGLSGAGSRFRRDVRGK